MSTRPVLPRCIAPALGPAPAPDPSAAAAAAAPAFCGACVRSPWAGSPLPCVAASAAAAAAVVVPRRVPRRRRAISISTTTTTTTTTSTSTTRTTTRACADHVTASPASLLRYMHDLRPRLSHLDARARARVLAALEVASVAHAGQTRKSGEPFIIHPIAVAAILADMRMDRDSIIAGLLHDTVEDTHVTLEEVEHIFGRDVRKIVEGETKFSKLATKVYGQASSVSATRAVAERFPQPSQVVDQSQPSPSPSSPNPSSVAGSENGFPTSAAESNGTASVSPPSKASSQYSEKNSSTEKSTVHNLVSQCERDQAKREAERDKQADNLRAMFLAMTEDVRVIIVKLADRLHNMRTLEHMSPVKQKSKAKETLEFFAPLAHRLGMRRIKSELEELSFRYLYPNEYRHLRNEVEALKRRSRFAHHMSAAEVTVKEILQSDAILHNMIRSVQVEGTTKELYSIYRRTVQGETLFSMLDMATLRIVVDLDPSVDSNQACYHVLGRLHALWTPLPKRLKDYIAFPKPNGYQSLHTTVRLDQSHGFFPLEIQIRTAAMHRIAEEGIAAELFQSDPSAISRNHPSGSTNTSASGQCHPSSSSSLPSTGFDTPSTTPDFSINADPSSPPSIDRIPGASLTRGDDEWRRRTKGWLISIREYIEEFSSSRDLVDAVRRDLLGNRVFVFTPKGRIVDLPNDSTPVDLAYAIHSDVGNTMIGAKINGRMVGLDYKLQNADVVKIITSSSSPGPSEEWMSYAKSRTARQKIRQFLRAQERENKIERGRAKLAEAARIRMDPEPTEAGLVEIMPRLHAVLSTVSGLRHIRSVDDLLIAVSRGVVGSGNLSLEETVLTVLRGRRQSFFDSSAEISATLNSEENSADSKSRPPLHFEATAVSQSSNGQDFTSEESAFVELGHCCHPIRGDGIAGLRHEHDSGGVVIHRDNCAHIARALRDRRAKARLVHVRWTNESSPWDETGYPANLSLTHVLLEDWSLTTSPSAESRSKRHCQPAHIEITARDCDGLLSYLTGIVAGLGKSIRRSCTETDPATLIATFAFEVMVEGTDELRRIMDRLNECEEVMSVRRFDANEGNAYFPSFRRTRSTEQIQHPATTGQAKLVEIVVDHDNGGDGAAPVVRGGGGSSMSTAEFAPDIDDVGIGYRVSDDLLEADTLVADDESRNMGDFSTL